MTLNYTKKLLAGALALVLVAGMTSPAFAGGVVPQPGDMIGSTCEQSCTNTGAIKLISQIDGSQILIGDPTTTGSISGLDFDSTGKLWGANNHAPDGCSETVRSDLIEINSITGALISTIPITDSVGGADVALQDLGTQPGSDTLFGITHICDDVWSPIFTGHQLVTVDTNSGVATLVGTITVNNDDADKLPMDFAPDGTLYVFSEDDSTLYTLNPNDASTLTSVASTAGSLTGLGVRSDGTIFGASAPTVLTVNALDGSTVLIGSGLDQITDLTFVPAMKVAGELLPFDSTALFLAGIQSMTVWMVPTVLGLAGAGIYLVKFRANKE